MKYNELIKNIVAEYGTDSYNVEKVLKDKIQSNLLDVAGEWFIFEMYDKKFLIELTIKFKNEDFEENYSYTIL